MREFEQQGGIAFFPDPLLPPGPVLLSAIPAIGTVLDPDGTRRQKEFSLWMNWKRRSFLPVIRTAGSISGCVQLDLNLRD